MILGSQSGYLGLGGLFRVGAAGKCFFAPAFNQLVDRPSLFLPFVGVDFGFPLGQFFRMNNQISPFRNSLFTGIRLPAFIDGGSYFLFR